MSAYRPDLQYASFDLAEMEDGGVLQTELLDEVVRRLDDGRLHPA